MVTVSENMDNKIAITLNQEQPLACESVCQKIEKLINNFVKQNGKIEEIVMVISLLPIVDQPVPNLYREDRQNQE
tara:strand:- start:173 stop:397 length:225 start_codon:yes stop_codon:yes gene_type:complete